MTCNFTKSLAVFVGVMALASCGGEEPKSVSDNVSSSDIRKLESKATACAAGQTVSLSAGVKADLVEAIKGNVDFSASAKKALVGAVFDGADISDPNVLKAYEIYESCLRNLKF